MAKVKNQTERVEGNGKLDYKSLFSSNDNIKQFVVTWQAAEGVDEVCKKMNMKKEDVAKAVVRLRNPKGKFCLALKSLRGSGRRVTIDKKFLSELQGLVKTD